jgi:hypothetical protein
MATAVAERILVMVSGRIALETTATELTGDVEAQRRYLGVEPLAAPLDRCSSPSPTLRNPDDRNDR